MRRILTVLILLLIASLALPFSSRAQSTVKISKLEVDIDPEYDQPSVLVIYRITLAANTTLPAELSIRIPSSVAEPYALAARQVDGSLLNIAHTQISSGSWNTIKFNATTPEIQLEYYDPSLSKQGAQRHYEYSWPGDYAIDSLTIVVQQPTGASDMRIEPSLGNGSKYEDGLTYYTAKFNSLPAGQTFKITIDYQKSSDTLSAENLPVQPSKPLTSETPGRLQLIGFLPWVLGLLGVLLIVGGGWWYWQSGNKIVHPADQKRGRRRSAGAEPAEAEAGAIYCHECGKRATATDRFCRTCGSKLRTE